MNRLVTLLVLACATAVALAADKQQVYKWTDVNGVVHFSDAPPPSDTKNVESLLLVGGTSSASETPAADDKAKPASQAVSPENRAKECEKAKRNLAMLQSNNPVSEVGPDGKAKPIDDQERNSRIGGVIDRIAQLCDK